MPARNARAYFRTEVLNLHVDENTLEVASDWCRINDFSNEIRGSRVNMRNIRIFPVILWPLPNLSDKAEIGGKQLGAVEGDSFHGARLPSVAAVVFASMNLELAVIEDVGNVVVGAVLLFGRIENNRLDGLHYIG